jgi:hypothetical protein
MPTLLKCRSNLKDNYPSFPFDNKLFTAIADRLYCRKLFPLLINVFVRCQHLLRMVTDHSHIKEPARVALFLISVYLYSYCLFIYIHPLLESKVRPVRKADNLSTICEPIV